MPAGNAYPSGHLVPSPILGLANAPIVETKFLELAMSLLDFSPRIPVGTFSILLIRTQLHPRDPENRQQNRFSERRFSEKKPVTTGWMGKRGLAYCQLGFIGK